MKIVCKKEFNHNDRKYHIGQVYEIYNFEKTPVKFPTYEFGDDGDYFILTDDYFDSADPAHPISKPIGLWFSSNSTDKTYKYSLWKYFYTNKEYRKQKLEKINEIEN